MATPDAEHSVGDCAGTALRRDLMARRAALLRARGRRSRGTGATGRSPRARRLSPRSEAPPEGLVGDRPLGSPAGRSPCRRHVERQLDREQADQEGVDRAARREPCAGKRLEQGPRCWRHARPPGLAWATAPGPPCGIPRIRPHPKPSSRDAHVQGARLDLGRLERLDLGPVAAIELEAHLAAERRPRPSAPSSCARTAIGSRGPRPSAPSCAAHCTAPSALTIPISEQLPVVRGGHPRTRSSPPNSLPMFPNRMQAGLVVVPRAVGRRRRPVTWKRAWRERCGCRSRRTRRARPST